MRYFYNLGIYLLGGLYRLATIFVPKARQWWMGRQEWRQQLREVVAGWPSDQPRIWIHCASLGEFEQGRPLIEEMKQEQPSIRVLLTFFSPSGYSVRKDYPLADQVMYLPLDRPANARDFLEILQPDLGVFVKYEFWWNYIACAKKRAIPLVLIAGLFRPQQYFFSLYGGWFRRQLASFAHFYLQNESSARVLRRAGISEMTVVGDPRVDRVLQIAKEVRSFPKIEAWRTERPTLVVGSSWPPDERRLVTFFAEALPADWCVILAPHDIGARHIQQIEENLPLPYEKYSDWSENQPGSSRVLIIDNIGMLSGLYQYARIAYVGGGFGAGIHNTLEPMAFGLPLIFGPKHEKFEEARQTVERGGAYVIQDVQQLKTAFAALLQADRYEQSREVVQNYLQESRHATQKIFTSLRSRGFLPD
ncbi:MAG TPA: glycosyltransferase N-terminal domain-containing protein [Saprospiraceae bacterium]|nr:glycosyltransferase N-terminal domain-containing protein [Saprospiraceae bacterium]